LTIKTDKRERHYFYDGKTVTVYAPALKYYSVFPAADTIAKTIEEAEETYGVEVPLADLFYLGTKGSKADASNIISAFYVSDSTINGTVCAHYAYRTATANFQVWLPKEGEPLPCKIVRDIPDDPARPQYTAVLTWKPNDTFAEDVFTFAHEDAKKIEMVEVSRRRRTHRLDHEEHHAVSVEDACSGLALSAERSRAGAGHRSMRRRAGRWSWWRWFRGGGGGGFGGAHA
jgi:hypothetical protein